MSAESRNSGIGVFLASIAVVCLASSGLCRAEADDDRYLNAVREFADKVLECGRDVYGPKHTPLFVDGVNADTLEPVKWKYQGQEWIMSNLATQQNLFRVFDGLTRLTGDPKYHDAAVAAIRYAFANLVDDNGLLCWGGHAMYDAGGDRLVGEGPKHELKHHYPYYELMWEVDPAATKRFIEAFWNSHILNWSNLDMNRHGKYHSTEGKFKFWNSGYKGGELGKLWGNEYEGGPIFFVGKGLTFDATGTDLMYAAALLHKFSGEKEPLIWAKRLAYRYVEARDPKTGLGGIQYSQIKKDRAQAQLEPELGEGVLEGQVLHPENAFLRAFLSAAARLKISEMLGEEGKEFRHWAVDDLVAYSKYAYRPEDNTFAPILADGRDLTGFELRRDGYFGKKGTILERKPANKRYLWTYALAYRLSGDEFIWHMLRTIFRANDLGEIGPSTAGPHKVNLEGMRQQAEIEIEYSHMDWGSTNASSIYFALEMYRITNDSQFLALARKVGDNILERKFRDGFFFPYGKNYQFSKFDTRAVPALLHLFATGRGNATIMPEAWPSRRGAFFQCPYADKGRQVSRMIYRAKRQGGLIFE